MNKQNNDNKEIKIALRYEIRSNETPEDLLDIECNSLESLSLELSKLKDIKEFQDTEIYRIEKQIADTKQENLHLKSQISQIKNEIINEKSSNISEPSKENSDCLENIYKEYENKFFKLLSENQELLKRVDEITTTQELDEVSLKKIQNLERILYKINEESSIIEKRIDVAETLLGLHD